MIAQPQPGRAAAEPGSLRRDLGVVGVWLVAVNGTIGAGIFGTPGAAARAMGAASPWLFVVCALLLAPVVLTFAAVASAFRASGGPMLYAREAFGPYIGFQVGWAFYVTRLAASAANVALLVDCVGYFWPALASSPWRGVSLASVCVVLTGANIVGNRAAIRGLGVLTFLKLSPLVALILMGAWLAPSSDPAFTAGDVPFGAALLLVVYAFVGWESAVVPAGEVRDPARVVPRALLWALAAVSVLYVVIQWISMRSVPTLGAATERPLIVVGEAVLGPLGASLIAAAIVVSVGGNVASAILSTPRITYAMSRDGMLPSVFGRVSARFGTPSWSIAIYGAAVFALAISGSFLLLAAISVLARLLIYGAVILASFRIRGSLRLPAGPLVPGLALAVCVALVTQVTWDTVWRTAACLVVGTVLFWGARRARDPRA